MNAKLAQIRAETLKLNRHIGLRAALTPFAIVLELVLTNPALAVDGKEYPGSMCEEGGRTKGNIEFTWEGEALNISTDNFSRLITCPLVRDAERSQGKILYAAVSVYKTSNVPMPCELRSKPYFGGSGWVQFITDTSGPGLHLLEIPVGADTFTSGSYHLNCYAQPAVPGQKSGISHYGIVEAD